MSYLDTIAKNAERAEQKAQTDRKIDKIKQLVTELMDKAKASEGSPEKRKDFSVFLLNRLTQLSADGARDSDLTGSACPTLDNPVEVVRHIDDFPVEFHPGTLVNLYKQLKSTNENYSVEMVKFYLEQILKDKPSVQLVQPLTIADLILRRHQE